MFCAVRGHLTEEEGLAEATEAHDAHLADIQRRERILAQLQGEHDHV